MTSEEWDLTFKGIVVMMNIDVPAADIRNVNLKPCQLCSLRFPDDGGTTGILVSHRHPHVRVGEHLLIVNIPLVPPVCVHQISFSFKCFLEDNASNNYLDMYPMEGRRDGVGC